MSFQRITTIGSMPFAKSEATASREIRSPSFSSRWISIRWPSRSLKPRSPASASASSRQRRDQHLGERLRLLHRRLDLVEAEEVAGLLDVVDDVVDLGRQAVDVLAVERRDEGRVEAPDDVVGDPVALLLGLEDLPVQALAAVGPPLEHLAQQLGRAQGVLPRLGEEVEEDSVLGREGEACHRREYRSFARWRGASGGSGAEIPRNVRRQARRRRARPTAAAARRSRPRRRRAARGSRRSAPDRGRAARWCPPRS